MKKYKILEVISDANPDNASLWTAEAIFGFSHLRHPLSSLEPNSSVLEVGCGSGILISMLAEEYKQHNFSGIEPFGSGFSNLRNINSTVRKMGVDLTIESYEQHNSEYDFIYCVNVFEHVDDWRHFLNWASNSLKKNGVVLVLCPNYGFPYESHFKIPIIINKYFTFEVFKRHIFSFEKENQCVGLWDSLNFVKKKEVVEFCNENFSELGFSLYDDISITDDLIKRLSEDDEFLKRQSLIGTVASFLRFIGVLGLVKKFPNSLPYMKLKFIKVG